MRAVFDVNVLIRVTFGSSLAARLIRAANQGTFTIVVAEVLIEELLQTASKPRLAERVDRTVLDGLVTFLKDEAEFIQPVPPFPACRDRDDEYLLALARDGVAQFLVTNDQDLLSLQRVAACEIVTPEQFAAGLETTR